MTVSHGSRTKEGAPQCTVIDTDNFSGFKRQSARAHDFLRSIYSAASMLCRPLADDREQLRTVMWLGREDSNLRMAESKSKWFALFVKTHSEKMREFDLDPIKRLADISECWDAHPASRCDAASCPPKAEVVSSNLAGRASESIA
jgi:hypothetical protein